MGSLITELQLCFTKWAFKTYTNKLLFTFFFYHLLYLYDKVYTEGKSKLYWLNEQQLFTGLKEPQKPSKN